MNNIFEQLGVYGIPQSKENAILACLLTGDPALLIGAQGTAKTALVDSIGAAFAERDKRIANKNKDPKYKIFKSHSYDASKLNFEDLVGFPNPEVMKQGKLEYIQTPVTVWDKDLACFDEFNRQEPARQNNIFELIRSRRLMGIPTNVKWVINCMNPFGMAGTEALDEAIVDRHQWFIFINRFVELDENTRSNIVGHMGPNDAIGLRQWAHITGDFDVSESVINNDGNIYNVNDKLADTGDNITKLLSKAANLYMSLQKEVGRGYKEFVSRFFVKFNKDIQDKKWGVELSGRRAGMVYRALLAYRAIDMARCHFDPKHSLCDLKDMFKQVLVMTLPIGIAHSNSTGLDSNAYGCISANVDLFGSFFKGTDVDRSISDLELIYELTTTTDIERKIELLTTEVKDDFVKNQVWTEIVNQTNSASVNTSDDIKNAITIGIIGHIMTVHPDIVPKNMQSIISAISFKKLYDINQLSPTVTLKGYAAIYKEDIDNLIKAQPDIFLKLQVKLLAEQFSNNFSGKKVSKSDYYKFTQEVISTCQSLNKTIKARELSIMKAKESATV